MLERMESRSPTIFGSLLFYMAYTFDSNSYLFPRGGVDGINYEGTLSAELVGPCLVMTHSNMVLDQL